MHGFYRLAALAASLVLAACGSPPPKPKRYPILVPAAELARLLPGHFIDMGALAPCDSGPLTFQPAGRFLWYNGFGNATGTYRVRDGVVDLDGNWGGARETYRIRFARDARGTLLHAFPENELGPTRLAPITADTPGIGCH